MVPEIKLNQKAQIPSLDTATSIITILFIVSLTTTHSYNILNRSENKEERINLQKKLYFATESLITTPGEPKDWHKTEKTERIGLAKYKENTVKNHELNPTKIQELQEKPIEKIKKSLALTKKEIELKITKMNGKKILKKTEIENKSINTVQIKRIALIEDEKHIITLKAKNTNKK